MIFLLIHNSPIFLISHSKFHTQQNSAFGPTPEAVLFLRVAAFGKTLHMYTAVYNLLIIVV